MKLPVTGDCHEELIFIINNVYLLVQSKCNINGTCYCATYHWVVAYAEEAHHLNVCGN